jgi:ribosome-associated protein
VSLPEAPSNTDPFWLTAVRAAESKKAYDIRVLDLREIASFTDFFVICSGANPRQIQAISEAVGEELAKRGEHPISVEGFQNAEWVLADYGDYIVHVFSDSAREYYDLERLWRHAKELKTPAAGRA